MPTGNTGTLNEYQTGQSIQEWTKKNLWKTAFKKFDVIWSAVFCKFYLVHSWILFPKCNWVHNHKTDSSGFGHIYWRNPWWKTSFFVLFTESSFKMLRMGEPRHHVDSFLGSKLKQLNHNKVFILRRTSL